MSISWADKQRSTLAGFLPDKEYSNRMTHLAYPLMVQQFIFSSLNLIGGLLVGQLGEDAIAAVGLANQIFFLLNLTIFGIISGASMFTAQLWGKRDVANIRKVLGLALALGMATSLVFLFFSLFLPEVVLGIFTKDPAVIAIGSSYLRIYCWSFLFFTITVTYAAILRSIGEVRLPVFITIASLLLNTALAFVLIFGKFGFPELGIDGAAVALLISRILECIVLLTFIYRLKLPPAAKLKELIGFDRAFTERVLNPVMPVVINEILWSLGITAYTIIYARLGTDQYAAFNMAATIDALAMVVFIGVGNATAIMIGNLIGEGEDLKAYNYAKKSIFIAITGGAVFGILILLLGPLVFSYYKVSPEVIAYAQSIILVMASLFWLRMTNLMLFLGAFRAGGDTRFALILDGVIIWLVGVPLTAYGAFVLKLPIQLVYLMTYSEEITKWVIALFRFFSKKWIHDLAETVTISPSD